MHLGSGKVRSAWRPRLLLPSPGVCDGGSRRRVARRTSTTPCLRVDSAVATNGEIIVTEHRLGRQARAHSAELVPQLHRKSVNDRFVSAAGPWGPSRGFVGRERDFSELGVALDEAVSGRGSLMLLAGEPGICKTQLADELTGHAEPFGARVLWGHCWEGGGAPAHRPSFQILGELLREHAGDQSQGRLAGALRARPAEVARLVRELAEGFRDHAQLMGMPSYPPTRTGSACLAASPQLAFTGETHLADLTVPLWAGCQGIMPRWTARATPQLRRGLLQRHGETTSESWNGGNRGGRMDTLWGLVRHAGGNVVVGPSLIVGALCLTIRSCWKSRDHRANVDRVCATFESKGGGLPGFDLASALAALHR
jgi:hypothetical protein